MTVRVYVDLDELEREIEGPKQGAVTWMRHLLKLLAEIRRLRRALIQVQERLDNLEDLHDDELA